MANIEDVPEEVSERLNRRLGHTVRVEQLERIANDPSAHGVWKSLAIFMDRYHANNIVRTLKKTHKGEDGWVFSVIHTDEGFVLAVKYTPNG